MTESEVVKEWIRQGEAKGILEERRKGILTLLNIRFPGAVPADVDKLINEQERLELLGDWFDAAIVATTFQQFLEVLKK